MAATLRELLIQRAARLQGRPAFTAEAWGTLSYGQFRNRVEGIALGLLATEPPLSPAIFCAASGPWAWASEVAAACCGLAWDEAGQSVPLDILGGPCFNNENGRGPYHDCEHDVNESSLFALKLDHGAMMLRLQRMNRMLGWDHDTEVRLPMAQSGTRSVRAALWCSLYAGAHAILEEPREAPTGFLARRRPQPNIWDATPFQTFWD